MIPMRFSGGRRLTVDPRLMLMKEDTTLYHLFVYFRDRVSVAAAHTQ